MSKILIIDDQAHLRQMLRVTLEFKGHKVVEAGNGREALECTGQGEFDLIFCDIDMPEMNGLDFVRHYRESGKAPIVMLTAEGQAIGDKALAAGANAVVQKPFEPIQLLGQIEKMLG